MFRRYLIFKEMICSQGGGMAAEDFKETIFEVVEILTEHKLSNSGRKLVTSYFNDAKLLNAYDRALFAINKYFPNSMPEEDERSDEMIALLDKLRRDARDWELE